MKSSVRRPSSFIDISWMNPHMLHSPAFLFSFCSGNQDIIVYACDCSSETPERAKEIVHSTNIFAVQNRFHPFFCDFAFTEFPKWLVCDSCVESFSLKQQEYSSGWYFFLVCFFILDYCNHRYISIWLILLTYYEQLMM
ncbi:hypothetical protein Peur_065705 [Populus x canadensis]